MIENLVFSGGAMRGFTFFGVMKYLEELKLLDKINNFAGTSIGACVAFCIILGYSQKEITDIFINIDMEKFRDISCENVLTVFETYGLDSGDKIAKTLEILLKNKLDKTDITFVELYEITNKKFTIVGTCLNNLKAEYFNIVRTPDMSVLTALRITYSIPFLFKPVKYNDNFYVDGAITENFPIHLFENNNQKTIGFVLTSKSIFNHTIDSIENYILSILWASFSHQLKDKIEKYNDIIVKIETDLDSFDFALDQEHKKELIELGYKACKQQIQEKFTFLL
jgi:predicted acylesterase/phospholipase RssA